MDKDSAEYHRISSEFLATAYEEDHRNVRRETYPNVGKVEVLRIERIENAALWTPFAAKRQQLHLRAEAEGIDFKDYERKYLFHGSSAIENIYKQGFQRNCK